MTDALSWMQAATAAVAPLTAPGQNPEPAAPVVAQETPTSRKVSQTPPEPTTAVAPEHEDAVAPVAEHPEAIQRDVVSTPSPGLCADAALPRTAPDTEDHREPPAPKEQPPMNMPAFNPFGDTSAPATQPETTTSPSPFVPAAPGTSTTNGATPAGGLGDLFGDAPAAGTAAPAPAPFDPFAPSDTPAPAPLSLEEPAPQPVSLPVSAPAAVSGWGDLFDDSSAAETAVPAPVPFNVPSTSDAPGDTQQAVSEAPTTRPSPAVGSDVTSATGDVAPPPTPPAAEKSDRSDTRLDAHTASLIKKIESETGMTTAQVIEQAVRLYDVIRSLP